MSGRQHAPAVFYPWERLSTHCTGGWVGGKSRPTGIWSPDLPAVAQSLYRLSYPAHPMSRHKFLFCFISVIVSHSSCTNCLMQYTRRHAIWSEQFLSAMWLHLKNIWEFSSNVAIGRTVADARTGTTGTVAQWKKSRTAFFAVHLSFHAFYPLTFRHRASCILGQAFHCSPENAFYVFNQQVYFIIWYLLDRASLI